MVNGGRIGFACQHAYPNSLLAGTDEKGVRAMLKGADAAVLHVLSALGVPCKILRVWEEQAEVDAWDISDEEEDERAEEALYVSEVRGEPVAKKAGGRAPKRHEGEWGEEFLRRHAKAQLDTGINWLGGRSAFPTWTLGTIGIFYGNEGAYPYEFYCALGIVAKVPPFADRPSVQAGQLAWAGTGSVAAAGAGQRKAGRK
ncbi:hypothetical protein ABPG75_008815 [Micractinium tetrahymenae]